MESSRFLELDEILRRMKAALDKSKPFSLARVGHAEMHLLSYKIWPDHKINLYFDHYRPYTGITELNDLMAGRMVSALKQADIVGLGSHTPYNQELLDKILAHYKLNFPNVCDAWICVEMIRSAEFWDIIKKYRVIIVGRRAVEGVKCFSEAGVNVVDTLELEGFEGMDGLLHSLGLKSDFDLAIIAASVPATIVCPEIAQQTGKVAIDFGHALDILIDGEDFDFEQIVKDFNKKLDERR